MIYLDNAATTKPSKEVLETFNKVNESFWSNPHSMHKLGVKADSLLEQSRKQCLDLLKADNYNFIFTSCATEANNLAIKGILDQYKTRGNHIITTKVEHPSVYNLFKDLEESGQYEVTWLDVDENGVVDVEQLKNSLKYETILVSIMYVNNEVGSINPIVGISDIIKEKSNAFFHVDAVQGVGKLYCSLKETKIDLLSISAHKFNGLKGSGALYVKDKVQLKQQMVGGGQEFYLRSGTADVARAACLAKALRLAIEASESDFNYVLDLKKTILESILEVEGVVLNGSNDYSISSPYIINVSVSGIKPETLLHAFEEKDVFISTVSACSSKTSKMSRIVYEATKSEVRANESIRISLSKDITKEDAKRFVNIFKEVVNKLR